ncbi:hypothetical protein ABTM72_19970, partial [Acinetobacter baumannii]
GRAIGSLSRTRLDKRTRVVLVGHQHFKLQGGQALKLTIPLNATGRALLRHFGRLPARLVVTLVTPTGKLTLDTLNTTIRQARKR